MRIIYPVKKNQATQCYELSVGQTEIVEFITVLDERVYVVKRQEEK
jgi:hypothetical protein